MGFPVRGMPDRSVVEISVPHLIRCVDHPNGFQIRTDLDDASALEREVGLPLALSQIHRKSTMSAFENVLRFRGKMVGLVEYFEPHLALPADRSVVISADVTDREQSREQGEGGDSLHGFLFYAINYRCRQPLW